MTNLNRYARVIVNYIDERGAQWVYDRIITYPDPAFFPIFNDGMDRSGLLSELCTKLQAWADGRNELYVTEKGCVDSVICIARSKERESNPITGRSGPYKDPLRRLIAMLRSESSSIVRNVNRELSNDAIRQRRATGFNFDRAFKELAALEQDLASMTPGEAHAKQRIQALLQTTGVPAIVGTYMHRFQSSFSAPAFKAQLAALRARIRMAR